MLSAVREELDRTYELSNAHLQFFRSNGFVKLKNVLSPGTIAYLDEVITSEVIRLNTQHLPLDKRDTYGKAFLQIMNLWTKSALVKEIVFNKRLAQLAADLLEVDGVRLYHDQALYKEPGGGHTPWHADQYYWPLNSDRAITVWIPLQATPSELGPLEFSAGSFRLTTGRDKPIGDESQKLLEDQLRKEGYQHYVDPFDIGEVSFHLGWLFHRAGPNQTSRMRKVMTMIYMDSQMKLKAPSNENQINDWNTWCPGAQIGEVIDTPLNPVLV